MKNILLKTSLVFVTAMFVVQLAFIASDLFYPRGIKTITNLVTSLYNQIG